jgi:hypothetical protein
MAAKKKIPAKKPAKRSAPPKSAAKKSAPARAGAKKAAGGNGSGEVVYSDVLHELRKGLVGRLIR